MSDTIARLESRIYDLSAENASLATSVEHLRQSVEKLNKAVDALQTTMSTGRGALWVIISVSGLLGGVVTTWLGKHT